jgi:hypothetical protein
MESARPRAQQASLENECIYVQSQIDPEWQPQNTFEKITAVIIHCQTIPKKKRRPSLRPAFVDRAYLAYGV